MICVSVKMSSPHFFVSNWHLNKWISEYKSLSFMSCSDAHAVSFQDILKSWELLAKRSGFCQHMRHRYRSERNLFYFWQLVFLHFSIVFVVCLQKAQPNICGLPLVFSQRHLYKYFGYYSAFIDSSSKAHSNTCIFFLRLDSIYTEQLYLISF